MKANTMRFSRTDLVFHIVNYVFLTFWLIIVALPLLNIVSNSLSSPGDVIAGRVFVWPVNFSLAAYARIITHPDLITGFKNSIFYTVVGTSINIVLSIMAAYPLSRKDLFGGKFLIGMFVFTMLFTGGLIPNYLVIRAIGIYNTRWALLLPNALTVYNVLLARSYFQHTIPAEMYEAAEIDGASDLQTLRMIVLPLAKPIVAVLTLFYAVSHWNSFFNGLIYLRSKELLPLQVVLRNLLASAYDMDTWAEVSRHAKGSDDIALFEVLRYAIIVVASIPVLLIYPFVQRYFVKGVMIGSIKG